MIARRGLHRLLGPLREVTRMGDLDRDFREIDRLLRRVTGASPFSFGNQSGEFMPAVDVKETPNEVVLTAELPGMKKEDIKLEVNDNVLTLRGERSAEKKEKTDRWHVEERMYGSFARSFQLPEAVNMDAIKATYKDGVLNLTIPKAVEQKPEPKQINIADE